MIRGLNKGVMIGGSSKVRKENAKEKRGKVTVASARKSNKGKGGALYRVRDESDSALPMPKNPWVLLLRFK